MSGVVTATNAGVSVASATETQEEVNLAVGLTAEGKRPEEVEEPKEEPKIEETPSGAPEKEAETSADSETEPAEEQEQAEKPPVKGKGGFQKRIKELTRERNEARERASALEASQQEKKAEPPKTDDEPKPENYDTYEKFVKAQARWEVRQEIAEQKKIDDQAAENERLKIVFDNFNKQVTSARETFDDFDEVLGSSVVIPKSVELAIPHLKNGAAVAYHLGKNPELAAQLMDMDPLEAVAEVGAMSRELAVKSTAVPAPDKKPERRASAPIQPVPTGSSKASLRLDDPDLSQADFNRIRDEQERARRKL